MQSNDLDALRDIVFSTSLGEVWFYAWNSLLMLLLNSIKFLAIHVIVLSRLIYLLYRICCKERVNGTRQSTLGELWATVATELNSFRIWMPVLYYQFTDPDLDVHDTQKFNESLLTPEAKEMYDRRAEIMEKALKEKEIPLRQNFIASQRH